MAKVVDFFTKQEIDMKKNYKREVTKLMKSTMNLTCYLSIFNRFALHVCEMETNLFEKFYKMDDSQKEASIREIEDLYNILSDTNNPDHQAVIQAIKTGNDNIYIQNEVLRAIVKERR